MFRCHVCGLEIKVLLTGQRQYQCNCAAELSGDGTQEMQRQLARRVEHKRREVAVVDLLESIGNPIHWPCGIPNCAICCR